MSGNSTSIAIVASLLALGGCGGPSASSVAQQTGAERSQPLTDSVPFVPTEPDKVASCGGRLSLFEQVVDVGAPYQNWSWQPLRFSIPSHAHVIDDTLVLLVPKLTWARGEVEALTVKRLHLDRLQWLPEVPAFSLGEAHMQPRYTEVKSAAFKDGIIVVWRGRRGRKGAVLAGSAWRDATDQEIAAAKWRGGLATHPAYPANPDLTTGVQIKTDSQNRIATLTKASGDGLGTIRFPTDPGSFIGTFADTSTALFSDGQRDMASYLVNLRTGSTCRVDKPLGYPMTAVLRPGRHIVLVNVLMTPRVRSNCPPGAPCKAPPQPHFAGISVVVMADSIP